MKKKLLLVGGGVIATHYEKGLKNSPNYDIVALSDLNPVCAARGLFFAPFFVDYHEALGVRPEIAMISTSTASHFQIAKQLLLGGVSVICEKPMCDSYDKILELCALSKEKNLDLGCLFHWIYADEVRYLNAHKEELGQIKDIKVTICDDYAKDGSVRPDRRGLCGAWLDSGINILSYLCRICDLTDYELLIEDYEKDEESGQYMYAHRVYRFGSTTADIVIDWRTPKREKLSEIICERGVIDVNHSLQTVELNGKTVYESPTKDRLSSHYSNAFAEYIPSKMELERTLLLHKILFEGTAQ